MGAALAFFIYEAKHVNPIRLDNKFELPVTSSTGQCVNTLGNKNVSASGTTRGYFEVIITIDAHPISPWPQLQFDRRRNGKVIRIRLARRPSRIGACVELRIARIPSIIGKNPWKRVGWSKGRAATALFVVDSGRFSVKAAIRSGGFVRVRCLRVAINELPGQLLLGARDPIVKRPLKRTSCRIVSVLRLVRLDGEKHIGRAPYRITRRQQRCVGLHRKVPLIGLCGRAVVAEYQTDAMYGTRQQEARWPIVDSGSSSRLARRAGDVGRAGHADTIEP